MMHSKFKTLVILTLVLILAACSKTPPSKFYLLTPTSPHTSKIRGGASISSVGIGPLELADYLDKKQIAIREYHNEISLDEYRRWAEPLDENIERVMKDNLIQRLRKWHVTSYPWKRSAKPLWQVKVNISRFDSDLHGLVRLNIRWKIIDTNNEKLSVRHQRQYVSQISHPKNYRAIAAAMSVNLAKATDGIAADLYSINRRR